MNGEMTNDWDLEIRPRKRLLDINFAEAWRYRDLIQLLVRRDFVAQYAQTILGPLWHVLQPIFQTVIFLLLFNKIASIPTDGIQPILFYIAGLSMWNYFSFCLTATSNTFILNAAIFGKVYFPRIVMPIATVMSNVFKFLIQFGLLLVAMAWYHFHGFPIHVTAWWLAIPVIVFVMALLGLGLGIIVSSLTTRYRDFSVLLTFGVQLAMYATPVIYSMSYAKEKGYAKYIALNPLSHLFEAFKFCLFGRGTFTAGELLYSLIFTLVALLIGLILFNRVERDFMDTV